jgi:hypothetical protein
LWQLKGAKEEMLDALRLLSVYATHFERSRDLIFHIFANPWDLSSAARMKLLDCVDHLESPRDRNELFLEIAITDPRKRIRLRAIESITVTPQIAANLDIFVPLDDASYRTRHVMLERPIASSI